MKNVINWLKRNMAEFWMLYIVAFCGGFAVGACEVQRYYIKHQSKAQRIVLEQYEKIVAYDKMIKEKSNE